MRLPILSLLLLTTATSAHATNQTSVIIDTDVGYDDLFAITLLLADPSINVLAITTVRGNGDVGPETSNIGRLLTLLARTDIPYAHGAARPLTGNNSFPEIYINQTNHLDGITLPTHALTEPSPSPAHHFLAHLLHSHPAHSITILSIAPLTNLAFLAHHDPVAFKRLGGVVFLGGAIKPSEGNVGPANLAEYNVWLDVIAAKQFIRALDGISFFVVDLGTATQIEMSEDYVKQAQEWSKGSPRPFGPLLIECIKGMLNTPDPFVYDALAAAFILRPDVIPQSRAVKIGVVTREESAEAEGETVERADGTAARVGVSVNATVFDLLMQRTCGGGGGGEM